MAADEDAHRVEGARRPARGPGLAGSILVVDDSEANRDALCRRLTRRGYALSSAADGAEALRLIEERAFDLVLLDVMMPGMSGLEVLEHVRRRRSPTDLPIVMATAKGESEDVVAALNLGANDYVTKPLDFDVVLARVRTQLTLKHSVAEILGLKERLGEQNRELETANVRLREAAERRRKELEAAAKVQESLLPTTLPETPGLRFAWAFRPCQELAGDSLNVCAFPDGRVGAYVLDVSGHGVGASLLAVAATRLLSAHDPDSIFFERHAGSVRRPASPAAVATRLDERFGWNPAIGQFITIFYVIIDPLTRTLSYVSAGHPGAIRVRPSGDAAVLDQSGMPIGLGDAYDEHVVELEPGERVYLYSDGVPEAMGGAGEQFGRERMIGSLKRSSTATLDESVATLLSDVAGWVGGAPARDDVSILAFECA